jgi:hypothetical protein
LHAPVDQVLHMLGIASLAERRETDDVGKEDSNDAALIGRRLEDVTA